jgi:hypothetical protein
VVPEQSAVAAQGRHLPALAPAVTHTPERHSTVEVQTPPPVANPQRPSPMSQTPVVHARPASPGEQVPPGIATPFAAFGRQVPAVVTSSHQFPGAQSPSPRHVVPQVPFAVLQKGAAAGHGLDVPLPLLPVQAAQVFAARSQIGVPPEQSELLKH